MKTLRTQDGARAGASSVLMRGHGSFNLNQHPYIYIYVYMLTMVLVYVPLSVCIGIYVYVCVCMYIYVYIYTCVCDAYTHALRHLRTCMQVPSCVCIHTYLHPVRSYCRPLLPHLLQAATTKTNTNDKNKSSTNNIKTVACRKCM